MPKKKKPVGKIYFTQETEDNIIKYNLTDDLLEREIIYKEHIEYPFNKIAENIINRFKFPYLGQSFDDTKKQVVAFLAMNLSKFKVEKENGKTGKAFSYFSVIAKNYLILHNNNGYKHEKRTIYLSEHNDGETSIEDILELETPDLEPRKDAREFIDLLIVYWDDNVNRIFKKKRDQDIANAVIELFRRVENIQNFNKKNLYLLIRELTNCKTSYITKVVNKMKKQVKEQYTQYVRSGMI